MKISRRKFLKGAAAGAAGLAISSMLPSFETKPFFNGAKAEETSAVAINPEIPAWLGEAPVINDSDISQTWVTDLLIVGAGNGGMMAASVAADNGIDFRVLEQNASIGPTRHWYGAINTKETRKAGVEVDVAKLRSELSRYASGKLDQRVLNVWLNESAAMHDYVAPILSAAGAECSFTVDGEKGDPHSTTYYYPPEEHYWGRINRNELFQNRIEEKGYYIDFNHSLVCLTKEDNKVTGAIAKNVLTDEYVKVVANWGVILATGGYEGNPEMIEALNPIVPKCVTANSFSITNKGMGIRAGIWAGAGRDIEPAPMIFDRGLVAPGVDAGYVLNEKGEKVWPGTVRQYNPGSQPFLKVDRDGKRFSNESQPYNDITHAAARRKGGVFAQIFDSNFQEDVQRFYTIGCSAMTRMQGDQLLEKTVQPHIDSGLIKKADTLDELADLMGFEGEAKKTFLATCERYHTLYENQLDEDFGKPAYRLSSLNKPPYYGLWLGGSLLCTMDSLTINENMQVIDKKCEVIEGLYATGNCAGTTFVDNYPEYAVGMCLGRNLTFAKHIVEKLLKDGIPTGKGPSMPVPEVEKDQTAEGCKDGTYTASAIGYAGPVPVTVEIKGEKIVSIVADVSSETAALGGAAGPVMIDNMLAANGTLNVDTVSGATVTSNALKAAVNECLKKAKQ